MHKLVEYGFNFNLEWYKIFDESFPKYQCVVGGIINSSHFTFYEIFHKWIENGLLKNERVLKFDPEFQQIG